MHSFPHVDKIVCSSRIRRFYFSINQQGEILSSLDKSAKEYITPRVVPSIPSSLRKTQSSKDVFGFKLQTEENIKSSRVAEAALAVKFETQDLFRRTQSSQETLKQSNAESTQLPPISGHQESPLKYARVRQLRAAAGPAPASGAVESKVCYYSVGSSVSATFPRLFELTRCAP